MARRKKQHTLAFSGNADTLLSGTDSRRVPQAEQRIRRRLQKLSASWRARLEDPDRFLPSADPVMDTTRGLGPAYRLNIIACILGLTRRSFGDKFEIHLPGVQSEVEAAERAGAGRLTRFMQLNQTRRPEESIILGGALPGELTSLVNARRGRLRRKVKTEELFGKSFHDVNAIDRYYRWLTEELEPLIDATELFDSTYTFFPNPERDVVYHELQDLIFNSNQNKGPLVLNPHAVGMWRGLTALAYKLCHEKGEDANGRGLPVCYIPILKRHEHSHTNIALIVAALVAFYKCEPIINVKRLDRWSSIRKAVAWLKTRMSEQACLIVLDAYWALDVKESALEVSRVIRDDYVLQLIAWLFEAPVGPPDGVIDLPEWRRNRIVILTERSLKPDEKRAPHEDIHPELRRLNTISMRIAQPDEGDMELILKDHDLRHTQTVMVMRNQYGPIEGKKSESVFRALDTLLSVFEATRSESKSASLRNEVQGAIDAAVQKQTRDGDILEAIVAALLLRLHKTRPVWWLALRLIALTPSGLQRSTLGRLLAGIGSNADAMALLDVTAKDIASWPQTEADFLKTLDKVLDDNIADDFDGFNDPEDMSRSSYAIDFTIPAVRKLIVEDLYSDSRRDAACTLQRYLSEETLSQQSLAFRRSTALRSESIRPYRRLIGAIYHGLLSLPFDDQGKFGKAAVNMVAPAIPNDPVEAWYYLRIVLMRTVLERAPHEWALSRTYAMDRLKLSLLEGFEAPWIWRPRGELPRELNVFTSLEERASESPAVEKAWQQKRVAEIKKDHFESKGLVRYSALKPDVKALSDRRGFKRWVDHQLMSLEIPEDDPKAGADLEAAIDERLHLVLGDKKIEVGEKRWALVSSHILAGQRALARYVGESEVSNDLEQYVKLAIDYLTSILPHLQKEPSDVLREVIDLLNRRAEVASLRAALNDAVLATRNKLPVHRDLVLYDYCLAYAYYEISEEVRLLARRIDALGRNARVSSHATRSAIRVALELHKRWRKAYRNGGGEDRFAAYARQMADILARSSQQPRERARLLVVDATIERLGRPDWQIDRRRPKVDDPNRAIARDALIRARGFLRDAEAITAGLSEDLRLSRLRLIEAVETNTELALVHSFDNPDFSSRYLDMARHDVDQLRLISKDMVQPFWIAQARLLELKVSRAGEVIVGARRVSGLRSPL